GREIANHHPTADAVRRHFAPLHLTAELLDPLAHAAEPEPVRPRARLATDAVVTDHELDAVVREREVDLELLRLGMRDRVADEFAQHPGQRRPLDDAEQDVL